MNNVTDVIQYLETQIFCIKESIKNNQKKVDFMKKEVLKETRKIEKVITHDSGMLEIAIHLKKKLTGEL